MEKNWTKQYSPGVPSEIDPSVYRSIPEIFEESFRKFREKPAFSNMGHSITYGDLDRMSRAFSAYLQGKGFKKGDRVAIMMPNILQYPVALLGVLRAGLIVVNVNPLYTPRELEHQLKDSGARAIIIAANFANTLEKVISKTPIELTLVTELGDMLKFPKNHIVNLVVKHVKKMVPAYKLPTAISLTKAVDEGMRLGFSRPTLEHEDIAFLQYTGGTTGVSKGAMLTHKNIIANVLQAKAWLTGFIKEGDEIIITPLPLYHIFALTANCIIYSTLGAQNILITNPRDMPGFIKELKKWKFTAITGVNTLFNGLLNNPEFKTVDFSSLRLTLGGGMAVQRAVAEKWQKVTRVPLIQAYGLTETSPAACINPMHLKEFNGAIGVPIPSTDVMVCDESFKEVALGEPGEICIRGPQVMKGYWKRDDETAKVLTQDGWLKTGDIAVRDDKGYFTIVDRKKDMILVSGFNVYPNEIEDVVASHPGVLEVAALGIPDEKSGEAVKIFVVKKDENLTDKDLIAFCKQNLTGYKVPRHVEFRKELPKTNIGKILRRALREEKPGQAAAR